MANKERNKRSARKARSQQRAERDGLQNAASSDSKATGVSQVQVTKVQKKATPKKSNGFIAQAKTYFADVRTEMRRVVWPSREELKNYSIGAVVMLIVAGFVIWLVDTGIMLILAALSGLRG